MNKPVIGITGASGFIGTKLSNAFLEKGYPVTALVHTNKKVSPGVMQIQGDLLSGIGLPEFLKDVSVLVHLSARQTPPEKNMFPDNVMATKNLLDACPDSVSQIIYLSSVAVYGENPEKEVTETTVCQPTTEYGVTKYMGEVLARYWGKRSGRITTILRPFNIYGKENTKGVISAMYQQIMKNNSVVVFGDGKQKRNFLYIDDVIDAIIKATEQKADGIFNLGSESNYTLLDVVSFFEKVLERNIQITYEKQEKGKPNTIYYSSSKALNILHWKQTVSLEQGIREISLS